MGVFALIVSIVAVGYRAPQQTTGVANASPVTSETQSKQTSVDEIVATNIAASLAQTTNLSVANNVANLSVSLTVQSELAQTDDIIVSKPLILDPTSESRQVTTYITVAGDTVDSIAAQFDVSKQTVKWANNLTADALAPGRTLKILPTDGILYTVKAGDSVESISQRYNADIARVVLANDLEEVGIVAGQQIILPSGTLPETERPGYVAPRVVSTFRSTATGSNSSNLFRASAGNRYSFGYCTWFVYERRAELGRPIGSFWGNATNWANSASRAGFNVSRTPEVGAIIQNGGGLGHVAIVESIQPNGDLVLSEMNYGGGWNQITRGRIIPSGQASSYNYIR